MITPLFMAEKIPTFDWIVINQLLARKRGEQTAFHRLLDVFKNEAPILIQEAQTAINIGDLRLVQEAVHKIKGSASVLGGNRVRQISTRIMERTQQGDLPEIELFDALVSELYVFIRMAEDLKP
jgi:HPt (histidine-containing phosphotransfer) domain-containing protein